MTFGGTSLGCCAGERPLILVRSPSLRCFPLFLSFCCIGRHFDLAYFVVKKHLELEGKFKERVQEAIKYASTIDELVYLRTLARHCLVPEPSDYVLRAIDREEKKRELSELFYVRSSFLLFLGINFTLLGAEMTTKFNKEMYAKIKGKKNEPLSAIGQKKLRITDKDKEKEMVERVSSTPALDLGEGQAASPGISIEEVVYPSKNQKTGDKGKEKVGSSVWEDAGVAMDRASELLTPGEMKEISSVPSYEMVSHHVHKLMQVVVLLLSLSSSSLRF